VTIAFRYAVFSYEHESEPIPVGVAIWSEEGRIHKLKMLGRDDQLRGFNSDLSWRFLALAEDQLKYWERVGLPYGEGAKPWSDAWWKVVRGLFVHQLRLSESRTIDTDEPSKAIGALFESIVAPHRSESTPQQRIDGVLGDLGVNCSDLVDESEQVDPDATWLIKFKEELAKHPDSWIVLDTERGILFESTDESTFEHHLRTYSYEERLVLKVFHCSNYI
jgi:hypothetical protein